MKTIPINSMSELVTGQKYAISVKEMGCKWEGVATFSHLIKGGGYDAEVGLFSCDEDGEDGVFSLDEIVGKVVDDREIGEKILEEVVDERARCIQAVADEEELDGEMPESLWLDLCYNKDKATEVCRKIVRLTKENIINRINGEEVIPMIVKVNSIGC